VPSRGTRLPAGQDGPGEFENEIDGLQRSRVVGWRPAPNEAPGINLEDGCRAGLEDLSGRGKNDAARHAGRSERWLNEGPPCSNV